MNPKETPENKENKPGFVETARRSQIIECATAVIAELSPNEVSLAQIAKRAGVSTGVILYYFRSKEELIHEALLHSSAKIYAFISDRLDQTNATAALRSYIDAHVVCHATLKKETLVILRVPLANLTLRGATEIDVDKEVSRREGLRKLLRWGQKTGEFRTFDAPAMAIAIHAIIDEFAWQLATEINLDTKHCSKELIQLFERAILADSRSANSPDANIWQIFRSGGTT